MPKFRYDVINPKTGKPEEFTGVFDDQVKGDTWYQKHGKQWESEGKVLVGVKCGVYSKTNKKAKV